MYQISNGVFTNYLTYHEEVPTLSGLGVLLSLDTNVRKLLLHHLMLLWIFLSFLPRSPPSNPFSRLPSLPPSFLHSLAPSMDSKETLFTIHAPSFGWFIRLCASQSFSQP